VKKIILLAMMLCVVAIPLVFVKAEGQGPQNKFLRYVDRIPNRYIVVLNDDAVNKAANLDVPTVASTLINEFGGALHFTYQSALQGFAIEMPEVAAIALSNDPRVKHVIEDGYGYARQGGTKPTFFSLTQGGAANSEGLDAIDSQTLSFNQTLAFSYTGVFVDLFVLDTGIRITHTDFVAVSSRASVAQDLVDDDNNISTLPNSDRGGSDGIDTSDQGHGTGVASLAAGIYYGVAQSVLVKSVRVVRNGALLPFVWSEVTAGVDWVRANRVPNRPTVANLSFGGPQNLAFDAAVRNLIASGVVVVGAAPNSFTTNATTDSPGGIGEAIVVGGIDSNRNPETNLYRNLHSFGGTIDLFAPSTNFVRAFRDGDTSNRFTASGGTSFATALVSGVAAAYLQKFPSAAPATVSAAITNNATPGLIENPGSGSPNKILYNMFF
jgi:aqualysin 1